MRALSRCVLLLGALLAQPSLAEEVHAAVQPEESGLPTTDDRQVAAAPEVAPAPTDNQKSPHDMDLPTDEFGRPANACQLPWDYDPPR